MQGPSVTFGKCGLVVQHYAEQTTVDHQPVVIAVIDKSQLPELIHEMTDPSTGLCRSFVPDCPD